MTRHFRLSEAKPRQRTRTGAARARQFTRSLVQFLVAFGLISVPASAQAVTSPAGATRKPIRTRSWIAVGLGVGGSQNAGGLGALGEYVFQRDRHVFMFRAAGGAEIDIAGDGGESGIGDVGVLYGRAKNNEFGHVLIAGGVGALYGGCPNLRGKLCKTIPSLPLAAEVAFHFGPVIGVGAQLFANVNQRDLMYGGAIMLQLGWFGLNRSQ